jgi:hypothetical protein
MHTKTFQSHDEDKMATRLHALRGHLAAADNAFTVKGSCICGTVTYSAEQSGSALKIIYCKVTDTEHIGLRHTLQSPPQCSRHTP